MEKIIIYLPDVEFYLNDLVDILFRKEYFGFKEDALSYTTKIKRFIEDNISNTPPKDTPQELQRYGEKFILYKTNNHTTWYIFFSQEENAYFIQFITNNHTDFIANFNL